MTLEPVPRPRVRLIAGLDLIGRDEARALGLLALASFAFALGLLGGVIGDALMGLL